MAPFRKPVFSQGSAWLPPWLLCSSIQSDVRMFDTPSIISGSTKDIDELTLSSNAKLNSRTVLKDCTNRPDHMLCLSEDPLTNPNHCEIIQDQYFQIDTTLNRTSHFQKHEALVLQLSLSPRNTQANSSTKYDWELETEGCDISMSEGKIPLSTTHPVVQASTEAVPQFERHLQCGTCIGMPKNKIMEENLTSCEPTISDLSESRLPIKPCLLAEKAVCGSGGNSHERKRKFSHEQDVKRSAAKHRTAIRSVKRIKGSGSNIGNEDVHAAIGLTVATAETLVIAEIMNGCIACQECGPSAVLDAALKIKREREMCGLNDFTLECTAQENSCDLNWYEGLDDASLEEEYLLVRPMEAAEYAEHGPALTDSNLLGRNTCESPKNLTSTLCSGDCLLVNHEDSSLKQLEQQNRLSHNNAADMKLVNSSSPLTTNCVIVSGHTHQCNSAQPQMASKESFSSRWFGGWTGMDHDLEKLICQNKERNASNWKLLQLETSDLSEPWDVGIDRISCKNAWKTQKKGDLAQYTSGLSIENVEDQHKEMSTAGSCAEILMAMSQASVKCSSSALQEPLCSFVPCSITTKAIACGIEEVHNPAVNVVKQGKFTGSMMVADTNQEGPDDPKTADQGQCVSSILIQDGVKRTELSSLKHHSASPFSPLLEAVRLEIDKQQFLQAAPEVVREAQRTESEHTAKTKVSNVVENKTKTNDQNKIALQGLELQESPPLTWHRGKKHRLRACRIVESALIDDTDVGYLPDMITDHQPMAMNEQGLGKTSTIANCRPSDEGSPKGGKSYNLRERIGSRLFEGLQFLLTGFPPKQKTLCEEVGQKIKDNGGTLLTTVPSISSQWSNRIHEWQHTMAHCPIIIAPQKVRTMKYLYGCAVGSLIVKPSWLDECISSNSILHKNKDPEKGTKWDYTTHTFLRFKEESKCLIFECVAAFLHGQEEYCTKLSSLFQHGGGRILQRLQNPVRGTSSIHIVVVEHQSRIPGSLKQQAARLGLPIVAGDWIIKSLLDGRLLPLPDSALWKQKDCANGTQSASLASRKRKGCTVGSQNLFAINKRTLERKPLQEKKVAAKRKVITQVDVSDYICKERNPLHSRKKGVTELCVTFLGKGMATPELSRQRLSFDFLFPKHCKRYRSIQPSQSSYYREVCLNGIIYSAGDIVEIHPYMDDETEPYIAQIESFYAGPESGVKTRAVKAQNRKLARPCLMCCRWFYRPSDTGFPCLGHDNELYLSEHFDDKVPVHKIIKKVTLQLVVDGKILTNNDETGWGLAPEGSTSAKSTDYICKFFYDHTKESLHHLKSSFRS